MRLFSFLVEMLQRRKDIVLQQVLEKQDKIRYKKQKTKKTFYIYLLIFELFWAFK